MTGTLPSSRISRCAAARSGTVLIVVAGLSALLASMTIAFLIRQRSSAEESTQFEQDIQARIMLIAGCNYIQETSRIGYDDGVDPYHREAFGWVDVRQLNADGTPMIQGGGTQLLKPNSRWVGPGGESVLLRPEGDLLVFHAYDAMTGKPALQISTLTWADGWPHAVLGSTGESK